MPIEIVAVFVACQMNLTVCHNLPFIREQHVFETMDDCKAAIGEIVETESVYRKEQGLVDWVVMGKCKLWLNEGRL